MSLQMTELDVRLPDAKARAARGAGFRSAPMAEVACVLEDGRCREIVVPVRVGRVLTAESIGLPRAEDEAFDAIHALEGRVCFTMLTEMLSRRDHAKAEVRSKLARLGFREQEIEAALARAAELRFLDDDRFLASFIEERKRRGWGRRKIEVELARRGVDVREAPGYPESFFDEEDDVARARAVLARKPVPATRAYEKLVRHLMGRGFSSSVARQAVRERLDAEEDEGDC